MVCRKATWVNTDCGAFIKQFTQDSHHKHPQAITETIPQTVYISSANGGKYCSHPQQMSLRNSFGEDKFAYDIFFVIQ